MHNKRTRVSEKEGRKKKKEKKEKKKKEKKKKRRKKDCEKKLREKKFWWGNRNFGGKLPSQEKKWGGISSPYPLTFD